MRTSLGLRERLVHGEWGWLGERSHLRERSDFRERADLGEGRELGEYDRAGLRPGGRADGRRAGLAEVAGIRLRVVRHLKRPGVLPTLGRRSGPREWLGAALPGPLGPDLLGLWPGRGALRHREPHGRGQEGRPGR